MKRSLDFDRIKCQSVLYNHQSQKIEIDYLVGLSQWESLGIMRRNSIPLYAFLVFFILKEIIKKITKLDNFKPLLLSFLMLKIGSIALNLSASKPYIFQKKYIKIFDQSILNLTKTMPEASIYIHHDNYFDSLIQFGLWTSIRYGNCNNEQLKKMMGSSYPEISYSNLSYMSNTEVSRCDSNKSRNDYLSFLNRWLNVPNNVVRLDLCKELHSEPNKKVFFNR